MSLDAALVFREATVADLKSIMNVENAAFTVPWTEAAFRNEFIINQYAYYLLATYKDQVVGYAGVWLVLDEGHITNIAIHPDFQGNHYGEALYGNDSCCKRARCCSDDIRSSRFKRCSTRALQEIRISRRRHSEKLLSGYERRCASDVGGLMKKIH